MHHSKLLPVLALSFAIVAPVVAQPFLNISRPSGPVQLSLETDPGSEYRLEGSSSLTPGTWDFLATLQTTGGLATWNDAQTSQLPQRFYRAVQLDPAPTETARDFRLLLIGQTVSIFGNNFFLIALPFQLIASLMNRDMQALMVRKRYGRGSTSKNGA